jgi:hypothetical protein
VDLIWTNPLSIDTRPGAGFLYFARIVDPTTGCEHRYNGKSTTGESRLRAYCRNVEKVFAGLPRRPTVGQEKYRAIHLAMAKACEHGWEYDFWPLEGTEPENLNQLERLRIAELLCDLNTARSWAVADYARLTIADLCR